MKYLDIPLGPDHPIGEKIEWARRLHELHGHRMVEIPGLQGLIEEYDKAITENWQVMKRTGVVAECTRCALEDGGSCCGRGIEDKFDVVLLLLNLLMGAELPSQRHEQDGCWFLGPKGCRIKARHVICVNFICKRLYGSVSPEGIRRVQEAMEQETTLAFMLEESIKSWLMTNLR